MTSHLDIVPTLLPLLRVRNLPQDFSLGYDLYSGTERRYTVIGDWSRIAYVDKDFKAVFPFSNKALNQSSFTTKDDMKLQDPEVFWQSRKNIIVDVMKNLNTF